MKTLLIIPAYNEALNIEKVIGDIKQNAPQYDYLIINDCSKDNTYEICVRDNYNVLSLPINYGLASAVQVGMKYALENNYDIAIQFDGDGQHEARFLKNIVEEIQKGSDIVIGSRFINEKKPITPRMMGSRLITRIINITTGKKITDPTSGMRAFNKKCMEELVVNMNLPPEPDTLVYMIKKGFKVKEIQVEINERIFGHSYLTMWKSLKYMINVFVSIIFIRAFQRKNKKVNE